VQVVSQGGKSAPAGAPAPGPIKPGPISPGPIRPTGQPVQQQQQGTLLRPAPSPASAPVSAASTPKPAATERVKSSTHAQPVAMSPQQHHHQLQKEKEHHSSSKDSKSSSSSSSSVASPSASSSSGSKTARPNLLESRQEQNKQQDLPLNVKMMLQKRPEMWSDPQFAKNYPLQVWVSTAHVQCWDAIPMND
jgi:DNA polymerase III gamma/tau subunit